MFYEHFFTLFFHKYPDPNYTPYTTYLDDKYLNLSGKMIKELNKFQEKALSFKDYSSYYDVLYPTLGLTGEAGEVSDKIKKVIRDHDGVFTTSIKLDIAEELGDVLWNIAVLASELGYSLQQIAEINIEKLNSRKARDVIKGSGDHR